MDKDIKMTIDLICKECNKSSSSCELCEHLKNIEIKVKNEK